MPEPHPDTEEDLSQLSFESALAEIEHEAARLEGGQLALAEALKSYERGVALMRHAETLLETVQRELEIIDARGTSRVEREAVLGGPD